MRHVFEEKTFNEGFGGVSGKPWFFIGPHLDTVRPHEIFSDWAENFSGDTYDYISEVVLSFFKNLTFFFVGKKNTERFFGKPVSWHSKPYKSA